MFRALLLFLAATLAGPAAAQTVLRLGQPMQGRLEGSDARTARGVHYDVYIFRSDAAGPVTFQLRSDAFDAYLYAGTGTGDAWEETDADDDGGAGLDSRLVMTLRAGQTVVLRAASVGEGDTGAYTISADAGDVGGDGAGAEETTGEPVEVDPARIQALRIAAPAAGTLAPGGDALFRFTPPASGVFTVVVDTSDFDAMLQVGTLDGTTFTPTATDDDGGRGLNPLVVYPAESNGPVVVRVLGFDETGGRFGLRVLTGDQSTLYADPEAPFEEAGPEPAEVDPARILTLQATAQAPGVVEAGTVALYRFTPPASGVFTVVVDTSDFDAMLQVGTLDGTTFTPTATDDDGGRDLNPLLVVEGTAGIPLYVRVLGFADAGGAFGLRVLDGDVTSLYADPEDAHDGLMGPVLDFSTATPVGVGTTRRTVGAASPALEWDESRAYDLLRFDAPAAGPYTFVVTSTAFDPGVEVGQAVNDSVFVVLLADEDAGVGRAAVLVVDLEAGASYLRVVTDTLGRGAYTVEILAGDHGDTYLEANLPDRVEVDRAVRIRVGQVLDGALTASDPVDLPWDTATDLYLFEATAGQTITVDVESAGDVDPFVEVGTLEGDVFTKLADDDDSGDDLDARLTFTFERAGRYLLRVSAINRLNGAYTVRVGS